MITTYTQLMQEINECAALYHREEKVDNLENSEMLKLYIIFINLFGLIMMSNFPYNKTVKTNDT